MLPSPLPKADSLNILFDSTKEKPEFWFPLLERALPNDRFFAWPDLNGGDIDIAIVATHPPRTFAGLRRLKLIQSMWMGVENLVADPEVPRDVPLARLIDPGMVHAMAETVIAHLLDWHRHHYLYGSFQQEKKWKRLRQYLPSDRTVGLLGLGELGSYVAAKLLALDFKLAGWSRRPRKMDGVACSTDLAEVLRQSDAAVCLLPLTPETRNIVNGKTLSLLRPRGCIINVARGGHLVVPDLIAALDSEHLAHAYLDVFDPEPLPADSPLWSHPKITITPHSAALNDPRTSLPKIVANIERIRRGDAPLITVDFAAGY